MLPTYQKKLFLIYYIAMCSLFLIGNIGLIFSVQTFATFVFCIVIFLVILFPIIFLYHKKAGEIIGVMIIFLSLGLLPKCFQENNATDGNFKLISFSSEKYNFNPLNIIQEKEFLNTGILLSWILGISDEQLNGFVAKIYEYENKVKINLPSQLPNAIINKKEEKYFLYTPENAKKDQLIMVLNGSAGAFLFYQKYFKQYADMYNTKMVSPIFGWGNWNEDGGSELIFNTYYDLLKKN